MKLQNIIMSAAMMVASLTASAVPALPGFHNMIQPDGTMVRVQIIGDENFHYYQTELGEMMLPDNSGNLIKATPFQVAEARMLSERKRQALREQQRVSPKPIRRKFPTTGKVTGLIILVEYQDVKFTEAATPEHYRELCNKPGLESDLTTGSVYDYYVAQSDGKFTPEFDVYGPVTLPHNRAYYGMTDNGFNEQFRDACLIADAEGLDFSKYDINEDEFVDFLFLIYAGHGEAQGGPAESVWPAMQDLSNYVFDWFDGLQLGVAACSCELKGGSGTNLDGIGTICHEFSHILGLPDVYDTTNQGGYGMAHYDLMDVGSYNDNQKTPSGYTAMDKYTLGWIEPRLLESSQKNVRLEPFENSHDAIFLVNPENENEYFTLENRQQQGWDKGIPGHGLIISYIHYEKKLWDRNNLNSPMSADYEHISLVAADHEWLATPSSESGDPFPGRLGVTEFTPDSQGAWWFSSQKAPSFSITNISEQPDGAITFDYCADVAGIEEVAADNADTEVQIFDLQGRRITGTPAPGIYIRIQGSHTEKVAI